MYDGNGLATTFPIPKKYNNDNRCIIYSFEARTCILYPGEGYEIDGDNIVFSSPPPSGAVISFAMKPGVYSAESALDRITEGVQQTVSILEGVRRFCTDFEKSMNEKLLEKITSADAHMTQLNEDMHKKFNEKVAAASKDINAGLLKDIERLTLLVEDANDASERAKASFQKCEDSVSAVSDAETKAKEAVGRKAGELIGAIADAKSDCERAANKVEAAVMDGVETLQDKTNSGIVELKKVLEDCESQIRSLTARITDLESRLALSQQKAEYVQKLRRGGK